MEGGRRKKRHRTVGLWAEGLNRQSNRLNISAVKKQPLSPLLLNHSLPPRPTASVTTPSNSQANNPAALPVGTANAGLLEEPVIAHTCCITTPHNGYHTVAGHPQPAFCVVPQRVY